MKITILFSLLFFSLTSFGQQSKADAPIYKNILKMTPMKLIGLSNASVELSYERKTGNRFATELMASSILPESILDMGDGFTMNSKGFATAIEEKFYFHGNRTVRQYLSISVQYLHNRYHDIDCFTDQATNYDSLLYYPCYSDTISIKKQTLSFDVKWGLQLTVKRITFDFYSGIGLRYKDVRHYNRMNPDDKMSMPMEPNFWYFTNKEGHCWTISMPLNIRIGYAF